MKNWKKPLVIRNLAELNALNKAITRIEGDGHEPYDIDGFEVPELREALDPKNPKTILRAWLDKHEIGICDGGEAKLLKHANDYASWPQYFKARWNDDDGIRSWLQDEAYILHDCAPGSTHVESFAEYQKTAGARWGTSTRSPMRWLSWPFPKKRKAAKKPLTKKRPSVAKKKGKR